MFVRLQPCSCSREAEIKALQAKKEALQSAGGDSGLVKDEAKEEAGKEEVKVDAGAGGEAAAGGGGLEGVGEAEISTASGSPDSGLVSEGVKLDLKGKSDQAKIIELQKVFLCCVEVEYLCRVSFQCVMKDGETIKELKANLKKANNELKERSLLLDMYKTVTKETRDKVGLMAAEKKARGDLDEARYRFQHSI